MPIHYIYEKGKRIMTISLMSFISDEVYAKQVFIGKIVQENKSDSQGSGCLFQNDLVTAS